MTQAPHPCLWFDGKALEAAEFYCSVFKDSKIISRNPMVNEWEIMGMKIMGLNGGPMFKITPGISFFINLSSEAEINRIYNDLIEGGSALMPLGKYDWAPLYGWLKDKYGMTWQLSTGAADSIKLSLLFTDTVLGKATEATDLYITLFENSQSIFKAPYPADNPFAGYLMYSEFNLAGRAFAAMDGPGGHAFAFNEGVSLVVTCDTQPEIDHIWNNLTANGGSESQCGWLKDHYGVSWQIIPKILSEKMNAGDAMRSGQMMQALMGMKKLDIAALAAAYDAD
jgi:predicted 3-demethylubiquinone-9 3-methyltransferase (glyoxalase superfamily)